MVFESPESFSNPASRVALGLLVLAESHHCHAVLFSIGLAVAATIQKLMVGLAGIGRQEAEATEGSEDSLCTNPLRIVWSL